MRTYADHEIELYIASGDPFDKAGAYAIQNPQFRPVTDLAGCYANVMGLPLCHLLRLLRQTGCCDHANLPEVCQDTLQYACPVFEEFLSMP
jgi:predicted house-cleaning NTP pyrophosphatase (Maf/HAM1 superfamily)